MYILLLAYYKRKDVVAQIGLDGHGSIYPDSDVILCSQHETFTRVSVSPTSSPPDSPRSCSPHAGPTRALSPQVCSTQTLPPQVGSTQTLSPPTERARPLVVEDNPRVHKLTLHPRHTRVLVDLLCSSKVYRESFSSFWSRSDTTAPPLPDNASRDVVLRIRMTKPVVRFIDYESCYIINKILWEFIELDDALHWLSTLGGAFSNLGEHSQGFAEKAGENAWKQLVVAQKYGDKTVIAKCWLFIAMSCMQRREFEKSRTIVKRIFKQMQAKGVRDLVGSSKIRTICRGIWARLLYEIKQHQAGLAGDIEIECKFQVPSDCASKLENLGAKKLKTITLVDSYLDTVDYSLIKRDNWLRFRGGVLELKCPEPSIKHTTNTVYRELTDVSAIESVVGSPVPKSADNLPVGWRILARVICERDVWSYGGVGLTVDRLEDGYSIGELEMVVNDKSQVDSAQLGIDRLAEQLGFTKQTAGKLNHYLRSHDPEAFKILQDLNDQKKVLDTR